MTRLHPVTLDEIANRAGVSRGTVSRILNGKNKENRPAIARRSSEIRQMAVELGYRPNVAARSIFNGRFHALAFVTCGDMGKDWYPLSGLHGIHSVLEQMQWRLMFTELPADKIMNPELVPQLFREASVDGLIVNLLPVFSEQIVDYFESQPLPCVWLNLKRKMRSVHPDEFGGARMAVKWLSDRGHRHIGFFSRFPGPHAHFSITERRAGFIQVMNTLKLSPHRQFDPVNDRDELDRNPLERAARFLRAFPDLDAVVCYEVEESVCLSNMWSQMRSDRSKPLEIIGYGEREIRSVTGLPIATLIVPFKQVGHQAVHMLTQMLEDHDLEVPSVSVPFTSIQS